MAKHRGQGLLAQDNKVGLRNHDSVTTPNLTYAVLVMLARY